MAISVFGLYGFTTGPPKSFKLPWLQQTAKFTNYKHIILICYVTFMMQENDANGTQDARPNRCSFLARQIRRI